MITKVEHNADFCVVGGGLAGMLAAISAARHGLSVVLMQDRPVFGGNASSEIRMWVCGAHGNRETGIVEEIILENMYRNPYRNYSIWDSVLFEKMKAEENITVILNCSCNDIKMDGNKIVSVTGWQLTTYTYHTINAKIFADCSGDSILAPLTGAEFRRGREASSEFNEDIAPEKADNKTMGMSCLIQFREYASKRDFIAPTWARKYKDEDSLAYRGHKLINSAHNFWWMELGGTKDSIKDTESLRDDLLSIAFGVTDHIKNSCENNHDNWDIDWVGFLPGKRESLRYVGDHTLTQNDVRAEGKFDDLVAYGGWSMDDHFPEGMEYKGHSTIFHPAPSPYGIPYRSLYSKNIENLMFAGRNISATHTAMSSTRVMATCGLLGQAVGTAASFAVLNNLTPRGVYNEKIHELKNTLMADDCYLPFNERALPSLTIKAKTNAEVVKNGLERGENYWVGNNGDFVEYSFDNCEHISELRLVFDSNLERKTRNMLSNYPIDLEVQHVPESIIKEYKIVVETDNGEETIVECNNNYQRLAKHKIDKAVKKIKFIPSKTWGSEEFRLYSMEVR